MYCEVLANLRLLLMSCEVPELEGEPVSCPRLKMLMDMPNLPWDIIEYHGWSCNDKSSNIYVDPLVKTKCFRMAPIRSTDCVRGRVGFCKGTHSWEIHWPRTQRGCYPVIGVATAQAPLRCLDVGPLVGYNDQSWGWNLRDNRLYHDLWNNNSKPYPIFKNNNEDYVAPDVITVILNMDEGNLSFAINGTYLGIAFRGLQGKVLYPIVNTVSGFKPISIRYTGGLKSGSPSLKAICRLVIREALKSGKATKDMVNTLNGLGIPRELSNYVGNKRLIF